MSKGGSVRVLSRAEWGARPPKRAAGRMGGPARYVVLHHGASAPVTTPQQCQAALRGYQNLHMDTNKWDDVGYSFVVGEDGHVYEGRGWAAVGAHTKGYNAQAIGICVMGNFISQPPNALALGAIQRLVETGVAQGHVARDYTLIGHRDVGATECPGAAFHALIKTWPNYKLGL